MTLQDLMLKYLNKEMDAISLIRMLSGMFDPKNAVSLLSIICSITRLEQGDMDVDTFKTVFGLNEVGAEGIEGSSGEEGSCQGSTGVSNASGETYSNGNGFVP